MFSFGSSEYSTVGSFFAAIARHLTVGLGISKVSFALFLFCVFGTAANAEGLNPVEVAFNADMTMISEGETITGHLWYDGGLERRDVTVNDQNMTILVRPDKDAVFMMSEGMPMAMQMPLSPELRYINGELLNDVSLDVIGHETVSGEDTTKYSLDGKSILSVPMRGHLWATDDGIVMKIEGQNQVKGQWTDVYLLLENVLREISSANLFEIDAGVQIMRMN